MVGYWLERCCVMGGANRSPRVLSAIVNGFPRPDFGRVAQQRLLARPASHSTPPRQTQLRRGSQLPENRVGAPTPSRVPEEVACHIVRGSEFGKSVNVPADHVALIRSQCASGV